MIAIYKLVHTKKKSSALSAKYLANDCTYRMYKKKNSVKAVKKRK